MSELIAYQGELPSGWAILDFDKTCVSISLNGIKLKQKEYKKEGKYPVIDQGQELIGGYYDSEELVIQEDPPYVIFGDHTKVLKFVNFKFIAGADGLKVLRVIKLFDARLFFYFLHCIKLPSKGYARHFQFLRNAEFPLPPLPEQHRIVAKIEELFSELDKAIESLKTAQQQLKVYRQAVLKHAFEGKLTNPEVKDGELPEGWVVNKLGKIFDTTSGGTPSRKIDSYFNGDIPWIKSGELRNSTIYSAEEYISEDALQNSSAKIFPVGTLLIALYGATIGKLSFLGIEAATNQAICGIFPSDELEIRYLFYYLNYRKRELIRLAVGGAQPNISQNILRDLSVVYPESIDAQNDVISEIESATSLCEKLEEGIDKNLVQMQAFKQSILKSAFEGKLVPQDPNDEPASVLLERIKFERSNTEPVKKTRAKKATA